MTSDNDSRITDYILNEMTDDERVAFEKELAESPELQAELEEMREMSEFLEEGFAREPEEELSDDRRDAVLAEARSSEPKPVKKIRAAWMIARIAAVAVVLLVAGAFLLPRLTGVKYGPAFSYDAEMSEANVQATKECYKSVDAKGKSEDVRNYQAPEVFDEIGPMANVKQVGQKRREQDRVHNTEEYSTIVENEFRRVSEHPLSTFSIDVDTASYAITRRYLTQNNSLPPMNAVRVEEFINYFRYNYPQPTDKHPFSVNLEAAPCPWNDAHRLVRIGLKGKEIPQDERKASNLVFLLDVSGSMNRPNKLPLLIEGMKMLVNQMGESDRIAITVYAGAAGLVLPSTSADKKDTILAALDRLRAGGSTNGGAGIELAYKTATENFITGGINRVILATDGDFNVGTTSEDALDRLIEEKAKTGVYLSVLGFGGGNYKDSKMEKISNKGNGNYAYIDSRREAEKVLVEEIGSTLITIAKDVKIQVEFNPAKVAGYRLIGYENRMLKKEDFNNDKKDAGEIGAGHTVTALYQVIPVGQAVPAGPRTDDLKYQRPNPSDVHDEFGNEIMTVKLRYKAPDGDTSTLMSVPLVDRDADLKSASADFKFAAAVAEFGMVLRNSKHKGSAGFESVQTLAKAGLEGAGDRARREEFIELVKKAKQLKSAR